MIFLFVVGYQRGEDIKKGKCERKVRCHLNDLYSRFLEFWNNFESFWGFEDGGLKKKLDC